MKQALLLLYFAAGLLFFGECAQETFSEEKSACYGTIDPCIFLNLTCSHGLTGFILSAQYGYQQNTSGCPNGPITYCNNSICCQSSQNACYKNFSKDDFSCLYWTCWKQGCPKYRAPWSAGGCSNLSNEYSGFVLLRYACLQDDHIVDMNERRSINGSLLAVRYSDSKNYSRYNFWQCRATLTPSSSGTVDITLVKEASKQNNKKCSMLSINDQPLFSCNSTNVTYHLLRESKSFDINLHRVNGNNFPHGWVLMQASNGTSVTVTCGEHCNETLDNCTAMESTPSTMESTSMDPSTAFSLATSTHSKTSGVLPSTESAPTLATHLTTVAASPGSNAGAVAGGVVAALLVLVAAVVGVVFFVRRRRQKLQEAKTAVTGTSPGRLPMNSLQSSSSSGHRPPQPGTAGKLAEASEPDYDRLGGKKPQSSSSNPAATYGRLGEVRGGGEDTDLSYDHLARGRQAAPDVIDSDYDTSALHVTSEGDYNVAGIPRKQHVITGSDYDVAQVVTSEGDYNRVDFQGKKQHVITGSDYDTAEIVTSEGDYNKVDFQGKKQKVVTGSDYDVATAVTSDNP